MHHVAIMNPKTCPVSEIISGKKTIESRWYSVRAAPWNTIEARDTIYFKESGKPVSAKAMVKKVVQYETLTPKIVEEIISTYGSQIAPKDKHEFHARALTKKYCILMFLENPQTVTPFTVNKKGFGSAAAWITVKNIEQLKLE